MSLGRQRPLLSAGARPHTLSPPREVTESPGQEPRAVMDKGQGLGSWKEVSCPFIFLRKDVFLSVWGLSCFKRSG